MFTNLKRKEVKIRKARNCWGCSTKYYPGMLMTYDVCVSEDGLCSSYWCEVCDAYIKNSKDSFEDGIAQYEFKGEEHWEKFRDNYLLATRKVLFEKYNKWKLINDLMRDVFKK